MIQNLDSIINYGELIKDLDEQFALKPEIQAYEEYSSREIMELELDLFGLYLSKHPITEVKANFKNIVSKYDLVITGEGQVDKQSFKGKVSTMIKSDQRNWL